MMSPVRGHRALLTSLRWPDAIPGAAVIALDEDHMLWSKLKTQLDKAIAANGREPLAPWTFHDLRRSLITGLHEHGLAQPHVIELIVNHVSGLRGGIAGIYDQSVRMDECRRALEAWTRLFLEGSSNRISHSEA
jgi:hypothetical protein